MKFLCTVRNLLQVNDPDPERVDQFGNRICIINLSAKENTTYTSSYDLTMYQPDCFRRLDGPQWEPPKEPEPTNPPKDLDEGPPKRVLMQQAKELGVTNTARMNKDELKEAIAEYTEVEVEEALN